MDATVQIVFFGEVMEGFHLEDVKRKVGQLLKLDETRVAQMFSGTRTVLKRAMRKASTKDLERLFLPPRSAEISWSRLLVDSGYELKLT